MSDTQSEDMNPTGGIETILAAASDSMSDQMVERLAATSAATLEIVDRLNDEETRDAIHSLLDQLTELHRAGGLVPLFELLHLLNAARNAMTDDMVERLSIFTEQMVNNLGSDETLELAHHTAEAICEAAKETEQTPPSGGLLNTLRMLSQPETQASLQFALRVAGKLRKCSSK